MQSSYCPSPYRYTRRVTREVMVGNVGVGGSNPIRIQSMLTSDTRDTDACVKEALELAEAGCEIIRLTAQTKAYAANLENIARELRAAGCHVPLVADIHFKPDAAMEAAKWVEKIRINPGNFVDKKKFEVREYSDAEYREELDRLREEFTPLVLFCREHGRAMRIGSNHGSLSDRILNRFGDTPEGMVESAIEFAQIARDLDYHSLVFSMKASNVKVMVAAYRLLVERMNALGPDWNYPIHLGVTEAGGGEDGRIKSAVGIGSLLTDGIGDTLRVSLTEDAVREVPVAYRLSNPFQPSERSDDPVSFPEPELSYDPLKFSKRQGGLPNALSSGKFLHDGQTFDSKGPYFPRRHMTRHLQFSGRTLSPKITDDSHRALCHRQLRDCIISPSELMASSKARWGGVGNLKGGGHLSRRQRPKAAAGRAR